MRRASLLLAVVSLALAAGPLLGEGPPGPDTPLETLLGRHAREQLVHQLEHRAHGGKSYAFERYAAWGRALLVHGTVEDPPVGPAPSARLSTNYRCVHCHSLVREDPRLESQDPEAREVLLRAAAPAHPERRDGASPSLLPGTTLWGVVNRTSFYNGFYERYRTLRVPSGERMNPERLADAIQICTRFCSAGRYVQPWEMDAILAALWDLELRLRDLPADAAREAEAALLSNDPKALAEARAHAKRSYLAVARADLLEKPTDLTPRADVYQGGRVVPGDGARGALVFAASCGGCHGGDVAAPPAAKLVRRAREDAHFYRPPLRGTERLGALYMPLFTAQRFSARQLADVRAWLAGRPGS